jgi:hypothetical protein
MQSAFESWIGHTVVVQMVLGQIKLSLRGELLEEQMDTLLMRPQFGPNLEICKTNVLAIEEMNARFGGRLLVPRWKRAPFYDTVVLEHPPRRLKRLRTK